MEKFTKSFVARVRVYNRANNQGQFKFYDADGEEHKFDSFAQGKAAGMTPATYALHLLAGKMPKQAKVLDMKALDIGGWNTSSDTLLTDTFEIGISELEEHEVHGRQFRLNMEYVISRAEYKEDYANIPANEVDLSPVAEEAAETKTEEELQA